MSFFVLPAMINEVDNVYDEDMKCDLEPLPQLTRAFTTTTRAITDITM